MAEEPVAGLFDGASGEGRHQVRCTHCLNPGWRRVIDQTLEAMIRGDLPASLSIPVIQERLTKATPEQLERLGMDPYRRPDGRPWSRFTINGHIVRCRKELWERVKRKRAGITD